MTTNKNAQAAATPPPVSYATLQADVEAYIADLLESTRHNYGETDAEATARIAAEAEKFQRAPWAALLWYAEYMAPKDQIALVECGELVPEGPAGAEDQLKPEYQVMDLEGEPTVFASIDGIIETARASGSPEAQVLLHTYETALAGIKVASGGAESQTMREQAVYIAMERLGMVLEFDADTRGTFQ